MRPSGRLTASVTVEASLALAFLIFACSYFYMFLAGELLQLRLQKNLDEICEKTAVWSYALAFADRYTQADLQALTDAEAPELMSLAGSALSALGGDEEAAARVGQFLLQQGTALIWQELLRQWLIGRVGEEVLQSAPIADGAAGLTLLGSTLQDRTLDLVLRYELESPLHFPFTLRMQVVQRSCRRLWAGTRTAERSAEETEPQEPQAYVTATGKVYHLTVECRSLKVEPRAVMATEVGGLRSADGAKYYPCESCCKGKKVLLGTLYVTDDGRRYHKSLDCSKLKRTVSGISLSEAQSHYRACAYCAR